MALNQSDRAENLLFTKRYVYVSIDGKPREYEIGSNRRREKKLRKKKYRAHP